MSYDTQPPQTPEQLNLSGSVEVEQAPNLLERVRSLGSDIVGRARSGLESARLNLPTYLAVGAVAAGGAAAVETSQAAAAGHHREASCENVMNPTEVSKVITSPLGRGRQSIVGAAIKAVRSARPSQRQSSYSGGETITDVSYVAKLAGSRRLGTYFIETYSKGKGRLISKDVTNIRLVELPGVFQGNYWHSPAEQLYPRYFFWMEGGSSEATVGLAPGNRYFWSIGLGYGQKKKYKDYYMLASTTPRGNELGGSNLGLNQAVLTSIGSQFIHVAERAEKHQPIAYQRVLPVEREATCG